MVVLATVIAITASGCTNEKRYLDRTVRYADYDVEFDSEKEALAFGHGACEALDGDKADQEKFAEEWVIPAEMSWVDPDKRVDEATEWLCPDHKGESLRFYHAKTVRLDATGRVEGNLAKSDWWDWKFVSESWQPWAGGQDVYDAKTHTTYVAMLHRGEVQWVAKHPTMPRFKPGTDVSTLIGNLDVGIANPLRVTDLRILNSHGKDNTPYTWVSHEIFPDSGTQSGVIRANRPEKMGEWTLRLVETVPSAGEPVDILTGITLVGRWEFKPYPEPEPPTPGTTSGGGDGNSYSYSGGGDDDDFNVPGWLCPTRFC